MVHPIPDARGHFLIRGQNVDMPKVCSLRSCSLTGTGECKRYRTETAPTHPNSFGQSRPRRAHNLLLRAPAALRKRRPLTSSNLSDALARIAAKVWTTRYKNAWSLLWYMFDQSERSSINTFVSPVSQCRHIFGKLKTQRGEFQEMAAPWLARFIPNWVLEQPWHIAVLAIL